MKGARLRQNLLLTLVLFLLAPSFLGAIPKEFYGDAFDSEGKFLFREEHHVHYKHDQVDKIRTTYYNHSDNLVAYMESYFREGLYLPNVYFRRLLDNFVARCIVDDGQVTLMRKNPKQDHYFEKIYHRKTDMVVGHGFYFFILDHLEALLKSETQETIDFLLPTRLAQYPCKMSAQLDPNDENVVFVEMRLKNPVTGFFLKKILVKLNRKTQQLISYEGPNTLLYCYQLLCYVRINYHT